MHIKAFTVLLVNGNIETILRDSASFYFWFFPKIIFLAPLRFVSLKFSKIYLIQGTQSSANDGIHKGACSNSTYPPTAIVVPPHTVSAF
jgi:hypothetical protein